MTSNLKRVLQAALASLFLVALATAQAQAQDAYRYWSYWWGDGGSWAYASAGPAQRVVKDGDVEGWRFVISADPVPTDQPREAPDFADICSGTAAADGKVRVGIVIDFGEPADAPAGSTIPAGDNPQATCVSVPDGSTGEQALAAAADVRSEQGGTCGIAGYPASGCYEVVTAPTDEATSQDEPAPPPSQMPVWAGVAALIAVGAAIVVVAARRRTPPSQ